MIVVIGNGSSRSVFDINLLNNHTSYGCNAIYRDYSPTYLVCGDHPMTWDICFSGYSKKNKCFFKSFDKIPAYSYEMIRSMYPTGFRVLENTPQTNEFVTMELENRDACIYWVGVDEQSEKIEWWGEEEDNNYNSGTAALRLACLMNPKEDIYCIGFDYYLDRTADNIFLGTKNYTYALNAKQALDCFDGENWIKMHKQIEEEFDNKIYHVGKHMNYIEFEELLNK